ncbi:MAG: hypothetical protein KDC71_12075 [Acidobacteria bacterium]|nr:hypothetical protein [Acidobacteriota bacterium]
MSTQVLSDTKIRFVEAFQILTLEEPLLERVKMAGCMLESVWPEDLPGPSWYDLKKSLVRLHRPDLSEEEAKDIQNQWFTIFKRLV